MKRAAVDYLIPQPWKAYNRELQEDDLAFLRAEKQYLNLLLTELPNRRLGTNCIETILFFRLPVLPIYRAAKQQRCTVSRHC